MKKIFNLALATIAVMFLTGCSDFLDTKTQNSISNEGYFISDQQAIDAADCLYPWLEDEWFYSQDMMWDVCATNQLVAARAGDAGSWFGTFNLNYDGDAATLPSQYNYCYQIISNSNWYIQALLEKQQKHELTAIETRTLGESQFMRAFAHWIMAYRYGCETSGVPFVRYEDFEGGYDYSIPTQQPTVMDNFRMIIEDLENAEKNLSSVEELQKIGERGRAHKAAAVAMMVKTYAYWATFDASKWDNVITLTEKLKTTYGRDLAADYNDLFAADPSRYFNSEYCWGIPGTGGGYPDGGGTWFETVCLAEDLNQGSGYDAWGEFNPSADLYEAMLEDGDPEQGETNTRLTRSVKHAGEHVMLFGNDVVLQPQYGDQTATGFFINKYTDALASMDGRNNTWNTSGRSTTMFHICRFADCLLYEAEAYLNKGDAGKAASIMNAIRKRSGLKENCTGTWKELLHERFVEFAFEGSNYLYDLKRWALKGKPEIKALAIAELEKHPRIWTYENKGTAADPNWECVKKGDPLPIYMDTNKKWDDHKFCFPYPSSVILNSNGALKQNPGY